MLVIACFDRFPEVFDCIVKVGSNNDCFYEDDIFPTNKYICLVTKIAFMLVLLLIHSLAVCGMVHKKGKGSPYSIAEHRVSELIPVLGSQPAGDVSHKPGGRLPLLFARPAVTPTTLKRAATDFTAW